MTSNVTFVLTHAPAAAMRAPGQVKNFRDHAHLDQVKLVKTGAMVSIDGRDYQLSVWGPQPREVASYSLDKWSQIAANVTEILNGTIGLHPDKDLNGAALDVNGVRLGDRTVKYLGKNSALFQNTAAVALGALNFARPVSTATADAILRPGYDRNEGAGPGGAPLTSSPPLLPLIQGVNKAALGRLMMEVDRQARDIEGYDSKDPEEVYEYVNTLMRPDSTGRPALAMRNCDSFIRGEDISRDGATRTAIADAVEKRVRWLGATAVRKMVNDKIDKSITGFNNWYVVSTQANSEKRRKARNAIMKEARDTATKAFPQSGTDAIRSTEVRDQINWQVLRGTAIRDMVANRLEQLIKEHQNRNAIVKAWYNFKAIPHNILSAVRLTDY